VSTDAETERKAHWYAADRLHWWLEDGSDIDEPDRGAIENAIEVIIDELLVKATAANHRTGCTGAECSGPACLYGIRERRHQPFFDTLTDKK
jgi:hypothetical protein